jgi:hypothetical protein
VKRRFFFGGGGFFFSFGGGERDGRRNNNDFDSFFFLFLDPDPRERAPSAHIQTHTDARTQKAHRQNPKERPAGLFFPAGARTTSLLLLLFFLTLSLSLLEGDSPPYNQPNQTHVTVLPPSFF